MKPKNPKPPVTLPPGVDALLGIEHVALALNVCSRKAIRMVSSGEFPTPDLMVGVFRCWRVSTFNAWVEARTNKLIPPNCRI